MTVKNANTIFIGLLFLAVSSSFNGIVCGSTKVVVDSPFGKIEGIKKTDKPTGESYVSFHGIPYAKPPVGPLRFHKPEPHPTLDGAFDATKKDWIICPHPNGTKFPGGFSDTEDCLVLNIFVKDVDASRKDLRKVLVFIHGGGFVQGSSYEYPAQSFVITQDVIVVTINYRLGVLGFLSTEDEASPGNYGLWDQTLALKWVKDNIRAFGGDPDDITLSGESAGGMSVGYQILTPHAKGLFSKAYQQSGFSTSSLVLSRQSRDVRLQSLKLAKGAECWSKSLDYNLSVDESKEILQCLRTVSVTVLTSIIGMANPDLVAFSPRVDGDFISDTASNLLKNDAYLESVGFFNRSHLVGINNMEIQFFNDIVAGVRHQIMADNESSLEEKKMLFGAFVQEIRNSNIKERLAIAHEPSDSIGKAVKDFYDRRFADDVSSITHMLRDVMFFAPVYDFLMAVARRESCSSYMLHFDYFPPFLKGIYRGMPHSLDLIYWFDISVQEAEQSMPIGAEGEMWEEDKELKKTFSSLIGSFVRYGNPGKSLTLKQHPSVWPKYDVTSSSYLDFNTNPSVRNFLDKDQQDFWFKTIPQLLEQDEAENTRRGGMHTEL